MPDDRNDNNSQTPRDPKIPGMPGGKKPTRTGWLYFILACALLGYAFFNMGSGFANSSNTVKLATSEMVSAIKQDRVEDLTYTVQDGSVTGHYWKTKKDKGDTSELKSFSSTYVGSDSLAELMAEHPDTKYIVNTNDPDFWGDLAMSVLPTIALIAIMFYFMRQMMGANNRNMQFGKTNAKTNEATRPKVKFEDVAGVDEAVEELEEIRDFLSDPDRYRKLGAKIPRGVLLVGPPGTGKTLLAKAVAGEAGVPFFSISGSDFVEMFVGVGASRVRDVFKQAKEKAPCIIFIDEIDAVGRARSKNPAMGGNDERENTLNALLTEMDGFGSNSGVIVLAATNRVDMLDKALLRAGRFDRQIRVDLPDLPERKAIFQVHMKPLKLDKNIDLDLLARQTPGFSGADIANVCNEAALIAARHDKKEVGYQDFLDAVDRIVGGLEKKTKVMTADEKRTIAIHEAGHATVSWFCEFANPLIKVTIVPRGQALGAAWYMPEERPISTKEQMLDEMCSLLGGRAAEQLFTGHISTGAMNDLERATKAAFSMVTYYGMSDKLPNICYYDNSEYGFQKPYSEKTACLIDEEVLKIVNQLYDRAKQILDEHKEGHAQLAQLLVEKEVVMAEDVERIFGKRPWSSRTQELMAEEEKNELRLENMPEAVRKAQEEHEKAEAEKDDHAEDDTEDKEKE